MSTLRERLKKLSPLGWIAAILLAVALLLRFYALDEFPPGVQHDEVFVANFAQTILQGTYPIFFELNRGNEPLFMYMTAGSFMLFGENVWALRGTAALCGFVALLLTFLLVRDMFQVAAGVRGERVAEDRAKSGAFIALVTVAGITFSFWHLYESRIGLHAISTYLLAAATLYAFWIGWTRSNRVALVLSGLFAGLSTYTYRSGIFVPVALVVFVVYSLVFHRKIWGRNLWLIPVIFILAVIVYAPLFYFITTHPETALARLGDLGSDIEALRQGNPIPLATNFARVVGMFGVSGDPEWRYNVALRPIFDPLWAVLFYSGAALAVWRFKQPAYALTLIWLLVMLLPSILSGSDLSQHRAVGAIGAAFILPAVTLDELRVFVVGRWGRVGSLAGGGITGALVLLAAVGGLNAYFVSWPSNPEVRLIQRSDLALAARWLDEHQTTERALVSAEFAADLDRGSFNLVTRHPNRALFFRGADTFVFPAMTNAFVVDTRSGPIADSFRKRFLSDAPVYQPRLADGRPEVQIYELTESELQILRTTRGLNTIARTTDGQISIRDAFLPSAAETGDTVRGELWWEIGAPRVTDADGLMWVGTLLDKLGYAWSEAGSLGYTPSQWQTSDLVASLLPLEIPVDAPPGEYGLAIALASNQGTVPLAYLDDAAASPLLLGETTVMRGPVPEVKPDLEVRYPSKAQFGAVQLLGSDAVGEAPAGGAWRLILFWRAEDKIPANYRLRLVATTEAGAEIVRRDETLLRGIYPTRQWRAGDYIRSVHDLDIPAEAPRGKAIVRVSLWTQDGRAVGRADGAPIAGIEIVGRSRSYSLPNPETPAAVRFGDAIELVGYDLPRSTVRAGEPMAVKLYWRAIQPADKSYTVFVHLLDSNGRVVGQKDALPLDGQAPTDSWLSGEVLTDEYSFALSSDAPPGAAAIEIGLYDPATGRRLAVSGDGGTAQGDHFKIDGLELGP
jgi:4-amino-4-deoxy-L-arabinose transferase-like glycosyltransferase